MNTPLLERLRAAALDGNKLCSEAAAELEYTLTQRNILAEALLNAKYAMHNDFEPDNQSRAYKAVCEALSKVGLC